MKYVFIINPVAGIGKSRTLVSEIEDYFKAHQGSYEILITEYAHHAMELAKEQAQTGQKMRIYACGGDGTLFDVVNGAVGYDNVEIGAIPCGSGNDFLKSYSSAENFRDISGQINGSSVPTDVIKFEDKYSINICSMGMDAEVVNHKNHLRILSRISGSFAYTFSVLTSFVLNMKNKFTITIDDEEPIKGVFLFVVAANGRFYGGGYQPAPYAVTDDGYMDIVLVNSVSRFKILTMLKKYRRGKHITMHEICSTRLAEKLVVEADREMSVNLDGEVFRRNKATFEILHHGVKFILPSVVTAKDHDSESDKAKSGVKAAVAFDKEQGCKNAAD